MIVRGEEHRRCSGMHRFFIIEIFYEIFYSHYVFKNKCEIHSARSGVESVFFFYHKVHGVRVK